MSLTTFGYANSFGALPMNMQMKVNLVIRFRELCSSYIGHWWIWFTKQSLIYGAREL